MAPIEQFSAPARAKKIDQAARDRATHDRSAIDGDLLPAERPGLMPMVAVLIALCFVVGAWFVYHQGQRDTLGDASAPASATEDATTGGANSSVADNADPAATTTFEQSSSFGKPDILVTVHPTAAQMQASAAKSAASKSMLAKATRPMKAAPAKIDREVALATRPQPVYPVQALRTREQGTVLVLAQVDINGQVSDARVVRRSGSHTLDRAAPNEVRRWKFSPALHDGQPIVASVEVPVSYRLDQ